MINIFDEDWDFQLLSNWYRYKWEIVIFQLQATIDKVLSPKYLSVERVIKFRHRINHVVVIRVVWATIRIIH